MIQQSASQQRQLFDRQIKSGRLAILLIVIATVINLIILFVDAPFYFYLTAALPYYLFFLSGLFCGIFAEGMYTEIGTTKAEMAVLESPGSFVASALFAVAVLAFFLVCWFFCQKKRGWFLAAAIAEGVNAIGLILPLFVFENAVIDLVIGLVFHGFMVYWIALAYRADKKKSLLPQDEARPFVPLTGDVFAGTDAGTISADPAMPYMQADPTAQAAPAAPANPAEPATPADSAAANAEPDPTSRPQ